MLCASCKNKSSPEQCTSNALKGLLFCGKHIKVKKKRLWADLFENKKQVILIQKIWRGFFVRKCLKLSGTGVLKRSVCHNDEDLVTTEVKTTVYPFNYFSITEGDKLYWFDVCSINQWVRNNSTNPYTRQPINLRDRSRLRELCVMRRRMHMPILHIPDSSLSAKWKEICQRIEENGFFDMNSLFFESLSKSSLHDFLMIMLQDLIAYASEHPKTSRRHVYVDWIRFRIQNFNKLKYVISEKVANTILNILYDLQNNYDICFIIVSARCRL